MHDVIVSGGGYNGISHGQKVSFLEYTNLLIYLLSLLLQKLQWRVIRHGEFYYLERDTKGKKGNIE